MSLISSNSFDEQGALAPSSRKIRPFYDHLQNSGNIMNMNVNSDNIKLTVGFDRGALVADKRDMGSNGTGNTFMSTS